MEKLKKLQCLDGSTLKLIAMALMVIDHVGLLLFPARIGFRIVGRLAFPIFAFFVAEGYVHTRSRELYIARMALFACISEFAFDLAVYGQWSMEHQNVMVTFFLALVGLYLRDQLMLRAKNPQQILMMNMASYVVIMAVAITAEMLNTDYGSFGVMLVFIYQVLHEQWMYKHVFGALLQIFGCTGIQKYSALSGLLLILYNGKRGVNLKYLFYIFYPAHLLILHFIAQWMAR